jgi:hypothetical protein
MSTPATTADARYGLIREPGAWVLWCYGHGYWRAEASDDNLGRLKRVQARMGGVILKRGEGPPAERPG